MSLKTKDYLLSNSGLRKDLFLRYNESGTGKFYSLNNQWMEFTTAFLNVQNCDRVKSCCIGSEHLCRLENVVFKARHCRGIRKTFRFSHFKLKLFR